MLSDADQFSQLLCSIDVDSNLTAVYELPVPLREVTHDLLIQLTTESASRYLTKLQSALSGKYVVKHYSLLVTLEKVRENETAGATSGAI